MKTKAYYYEFYPHYTGTKVSKLVFDPLVIALALTLSKQYNDEDLYAFLDELNDQGETYALTELLGESVKNLCKKLSNGNTFACDWEEGSHGLSLDSMLEAKRAVAAVEAKMQYNELLGEEG